MTFKENNKVDDVTKMVIKAIKAKRFNYNRYASVNKFHGVQVLASNKMQDDKHSEYSIEVLNADNTVAHTIKYVESIKEIYVDGELLQTVLRKDAEEWRENRKAKVEPILIKISERLQNVLDDIDKNTDGHLANLFEYCASPRFTAIGAGYSYNRGYFVQHIVDHLRDYVMRCDEGNGVYTLTQVEKMIDECRM